MLITVKTNDREMLYLII